MDEGVEDDTTNNSSCITANLNSSKRKSYPIYFQQQCIINFRNSKIPLHSFARNINVSYSSLHRWLKNEKRIMSIQDSRRKKRIRSIKSYSKKSIPFEDHLLSFCKDIRRANLTLTTTCMIEFIKTEYSNFIPKYFEGKIDPRNSLMRLLREFAYRNGIKQKSIGGSKLTSIQLSNIRLNFSKNFIQKYSRFPYSRIFNADETAIYYIPKMTRSLAFVGKPNKCIDHSKHGGRITALLTVTADGQKLPILFILKGKPNGIIERNEIPVLAAEFKDCIFAVQENAWMNDRVWSIFIEEIFMRNIVDESLLIVDNLECHKSALSIEKIAFAGSHLCTLPANSTGYCQPLDVGIIGPLKKKMQMLWMKEEKAWMQLNYEQLRKNAIQRTVNAYNSLEKNTIIRAWEKSVFYARESMERQLMLMNDDRSHIIEQINMSLEDKDINYM